MKKFSSLLRAVRVSRVLALVVISSTLSACAHLNTSRSTSANEAGAMTDAPGTIADLNDTGSDLEGLPIEVNKMVLQWVDYFQGRGRPHMERYLSRSTRYMPIMKAILKQEGLPEDLIYIALIESGFSSTAHSSANAVGYWQFIRGTGKHYGLKIDDYVDERRDFVLSTHAAADYFKGLYNLFGAWYLAIASYNVGENRVKGLVMKYHTRDFWQLARENKLPDETINYVPKFLAARLIAKEPEKYGFADVEYMPPLEFSEVEFNRSIDIRKLAQGMNLDYDDLRDLNPSYKRGVAFHKAGKLTLRVPKGTEERAVAAAAVAAAGSQAVYVADEDYTYYRVRRGDTIATLAKKFGTSQKQIRNMNKLSRGSRLAIGNRIRVPAEVGGLVRKEKGAEHASSKVASKKNSSSSSTNREKVLSLMNPNAPAKLSQPASLKKTPAQKVVAKNQRTAPASTRTVAGKAQKVYVVQRGDTLTEIAQKYKVSIRELANHNQLGRRAKIPVGAKLEIP